jgi:hypothetical protein
VQVVPSVRLALLAVPKVERTSVAQLERPVELVVLEAAPSVAPRWAHRTSMVLVVALVVPAAALVVARRTGVVEAWVRSVVVAAGRNAVAESAEEELAQEAQRSRVAWEREDEVERLEGAGIRHFLRRRRRRHSNRRCHSDSSSSLPSRR